MRERLLIRTMVILLSVIWTLSASDSIPKNTTRYTPFENSRWVSRSSRSFKPETKVLFWGDPFYLGIHGGFDGSIFRDEKTHFEPRFLYGLHFSWDYNLLIINWHFFTDLLRTDKRRLSVDLGVGMGPKILTVQYPVDLFLRIENNGVGGGVGGGVDLTFLKFHLKTGVIWNERYFIEFLTTAKIPIIKDRSKKREQRRKRYLPAQ